MRMRKITVAAAILFAGCATAPDLGDNPLSGTTWIAQEIGGQAVVSDQTASLTFESPVSVSGDTGCNSFLGAAEVDGFGLRFGRLVSTRMACSGPTGEQESRYLALLQKVGAYREEAGDLLLLAEDGRTLIRLRRL